jgi:alpha-tubulin suppressor-like RCC1 family protein
MTLTPIPDAGPYVTVPLTGCPFIGYNAPVTVGGQSFQLVIDTGSTDTAVALSTCTNCGVSPEYSPASGTCSGTVSDTYGISVSGSATSWSGENCSALVAVGKELPAVTIQFGGIANQSGFFYPYDCSMNPNNTLMQGILGLGPIGGDTLGQATDDAYFNELVSNGISDKMAVLLCSFGGQMWFGGYDPAYASGSPQYTPMTAAQSAYWSVNLTDVGLGGTSLGGADSQATVDTGTGELVLLTAAYNLLTTALTTNSGVASVFGEGSAFGSTAFDSSFFSGAECLAPMGCQTRADVDSALPPLTLTFPNQGSPGSFTLTLPASQSYLVPIVSNGATYYCWYVEDAQSNQAGNTILGDAVLRANITLFDEGNNQVGFVPQNYCEGGYTGADAGTAGDATVEGGAQDSGAAGDAAGAGDAASVTAAAVSVGSSSACALTAGGGVECWGDNSSGQLGNNAPVASSSVPPSSSVPVPVVGLSSGVVAVSVAGRAACALTAAGGVECWGDNDYGELGSNSSAFDSPVPVAVQGLASGVIDLSEGDGENGFCAVTAGGGVECWGDIAGSSLVPVAVTGFTSAVTTVSVGRGFACALTRRGGVECWGDDTYGQLGNSCITGNSGVPVPVTGLTSGVTSVVASNGFACAVLVSGAVDCWGDNSYGQLGNNPNPSPLPVAVTGLASGATAVSAGRESACAILSGGGVECWGNNTSGQLGNNSTTASSVPVPVGGLTGEVTALSVGESSACARIMGGGVECWGSNYAGVLGDSVPSFATSVPLPVTGLTSGVTAVSAGISSNCAVTASGGVECWGSNSSGQLGNASTTESEVPVPVTGLTSGVTAVSVGGDFACALAAGGAVDCWGTNSSGELGNNSDAGSSGVPVPVTGLASGVTAVSAGAESACAITSSGGVVCWGSNYGELGTYSDAATVFAPSPVTGLSSGVTAISVGYSACAITSGGGVECWGCLQGNQCSSVPTPVTGLTSGVTAISVGSSSACAITSGGGVECWGSNSSGELGNDSDAGSNLVPVQVTGLTSGVTSVSVGQGYACAVTAGGGVECWGDNMYDELGSNSDAGSSFVPVQVTGLTSGVTAVSSLGGLTTCALTAGGGVECWGNNSSDQLGNLSTAESLVAVPVTGF